MQGTTRLVLLQTCSVRVSFSWDGDRVTRGKP